MRLESLPLLFGRLSSFLNSGRVPSRIVWLLFFLDSVELWDILTNLVNLILLFVPHLLWTCPLRWRNIVEKKLLIFLLMLVIVAKKHVQVMLLVHFHSSRDFWLFHMLVFIHRVNFPVVTVSLMLDWRNFSAIFTHFFILLINLLTFISIDLLLLNHLIVLLHIIILTLRLAVCNRLFRRRVCCGLCLEIPIIAFLRLSFKNLFLLALSFFKLEFSI